MDKDISRKINEALEERNKRIKECKQKGHPGETVLMESDFAGYRKALCYCENCEDIYERNLTTDEAMKFTKKMQEHYTR